MFALAARASGIAPGDPSSVFAPENPILSLELSDETEGGALASYRGRAGFRASAEPDTFENPQVFAIVDHPASTLVGHTIRIDAVLTDSLGTSRCGSLAIRAGGGT